MSETSQASSDNEKSKRPSGSRKRQVHNEVERRRKDKINGWISKIGDLLPSKELHKRSKISILEQTVDYIKLLVSEREKLLSENRSEVQAEEVRQLKKDLKHVQEQNTVYEKLLLQANISLNSLPKKPLKYSDKFERKNGILTVKNSDSNINSRVDSAIQVNGDVPVNIPSINLVSAPTCVACELPKKTKSSVKNNGKAKSAKKDKNGNSVPRVVVSDANENANRLSSCININSTTSLTTTYTVSQGNIISNMTCNDILKESPSAHSGGVTTVLSQFPLMSTTHSSSLVNMCNKNMSTIIIPTGGSILQHFPAAEKPSNTISIICPSTLPIIVPQQLFNVSSVSRSVGLSSTLICSGPVNDPCSQTEKSSLGNTLLTLNPGSVVPISSNISANGGIILSPQTAVIGNACASGNLTQNVISPIVQPAPQIQSEQVIVPLPLKAPITTSVTTLVEKNPLPPSQSIVSAGNQNSTDKNKNTSSSNAAEENATLPSTQLQSCESSSISESTSSVVDGNINNASSKKKNTSANREIRSIYFNSLPSLQVLSANKVISVVNQSQMWRTKLSLPLRGKEPSRTPSVSLLPSVNKSTQSSNNYCLQIDTPGVPTNVNESKGLVQPNVPPLSSSATTKKDSDLASKSNFSLNVLMGDTVSDKHENSHKTSKDLEPFISQNSVESVSKISVAAFTCSAHSTLSNASTITTTTYSNIPVCTATSDSVKEGNSFNATAHFNTCTISNTELNSEPYKVCNPKNRIQKPSYSEASAQLNSNISDVSHNVLSSTSNLNNETSCVSTASAVLSNSNPVNQMEHNGFPKHNLQYNMCSKNNALVSKDINMLQNHNQNKQCSELITVDTVNNVFNESVPYAVNDSSINQNILPSLFSSNQIVTLNSSVFMCPVQDSIPSSAQLPHNTHVSNEVSSSTIATCMMPNSCTDLPSFTTLNKENMSNSFPILTVSNEISKRPNEQNSNTQCNSKSNDLKSDSKVSASVDASKQSPNAKKKKNGMKTCKVNSNDSQIMCNANDISEVNSGYELNKSQTTENSNSFSKNDETICSRQEPNNFLFTSDILARATESIFGSEMLDNSHLTKRTLMYYADDGTNINIPVSISEKQNVNYKLHCTPINIEHVETSSNLLNDNGRKQTGQLNMYSLDLASSETSDSNNQELKQNKNTKARKSKSVLDLEPPLKKMKESLDSSSKSSNSMFSNSHQNEEETEKESTPNPQSNISCEEKQVSSESHASETDPSGIDSMAHFGNNLPEGSCKTPTSVDAIFSLTPMLGDILKDVSHGIGMETRNGAYLSCNDNQALFPGEKNFISLNFVSNSNEDYLNLPRMHFPVSTEIPAAPATNVSFAHTMSLCSTQSDTAKTTETLSSADQQNKTDVKKKSNLCNTSDNLNSLGNTLTITNSIAKSSDCLPKLSNSEPSFSIAAKISSSSNSLLFDNQTPNVQNPSVNVSQSNSSIISQTDSHFSQRENFNNHSVTFYPSLSSSTNLQNFVSSSSSGLLHTNFHSSTSSNLTNVSFPAQTVNAVTNTAYHPQQSAPKVDSLSHSLCSLLKETSNILVENRVGASGPPSSQTTSSSSTSNISQSKYSALSLISDHSSYSESPSSSACHSEYVHSSVVCTPTVSETQYTLTNSSCSRNQRASLSYSAESLLQTSCASSEKSKNKNVVTNRYLQRTTEKKSERNNIANIHGIGDTNIFMPVSSCDISIQNAPLVPLPPVTSFHNFPASYTLCESVPSTTIFNSVTRNHDIPLSLSNENFLNHMNLNVESQMLSNRHDAATSTVPKPHSNITLPFENHASLYNNCNFLPHVKPPLETSRAPDSSSCFPSTSFSNNYSQTTQKTNCCHFPHRTLASSSELPTDISLPVGPPVPSFHTDKPNFQSNRSSLQTTFSQNNANFVGNIFYNTNNSTRDVNDMTAKPSNIRPTQEAFVPEGARQNLHDHNSSIIFPNRKTATSNRSKSKKGKNINVNDGNTNMIPSSMSNFPISQDLPCSKSNISCVPNGYFKNSTHSVIPPPPSQLPCSQHKLSENAPNSVIPTNPPFNPVLHQQGDNFFNLNFQPSNFAMSPLPRPPTQPLSCSCLTTPIISHTFSSTNHPVPNFNLSNILPDMGCSSNQVSLPPVKFPPVNHTLQSSSAQCQTNSTISSSAHIVSHQTCTPALYPPHPPMVRGSLNPILSHNPQSFSDNQVSLVGSGTAPVISQNITFSATQNPTFRNVIHSLSFPRSER
ncbi:basic helix-loop-helix domain-containing protein USF3 [Trichonephila clavata]|uniref:Basic helix-loop-helix domain-containing protein USF3 n=1 Tax=Trichonephila clavata TaxID=2740835 RepID=A0A8X6F6U7_TRICU|nr:basic helix-loop-helix domain-containing protein USF3 [Trichonephila clavata]